MGIGLMAIVSTCDLMVRDRGSSHHLLFDQEGREDAMFYRWDAVKLGESGEAHELFQWKDQSPGRKRGSNQMKCSAVPEYSDLPQW